MSWWRRLGEPSLETADGKVLFNPLQEAEEESTDDGQPDVITTDPDGIVDDAGGS